MFFYLYSFFLNSFLSLLPKLLFLSLFLFLLLSLILFLLLLILLIIWWILRFWFWLFFLSWLTILRYYNWINRSLNFFLLSMINNDRINLNLHWLLFDILLTCFWFRVVHCFSFFLSYFWLLLSIFLIQLRITIFISWRRISLLIVGIFCLCRTRSRRLVSTRMIAIQSASNWTFLETIVRNLPQFAY